MEARLVYHVKEYMAKEYAHIFESLEKLWKDFKGDIKRFKENTR